VAPILQLLAVAKRIVPEENDKPDFDEQTLAKLLEAAYVLQEHNRELQKLELNLELQREHLGAQEQPAPTPPRSETQTPISERSTVGLASAQTAPKDNYTVTLAQIVETQRQIQARHLELESAMSLVAERVTEIARAGGAAICFLDGQKVRYRGAAGLMTLPVGTEVPMEKALCVASLRTGQVIRCSDVNLEFLLDPEECRRRCIQAMIAVPVYHDGAIAGGLELYYATSQAFTEQDVHTCQLMAGLITEALAREEELSWKKSLASERALMLEALEKLKPNLAALVDIPAVKGSSSRSTAAGSGGTAIASVGSTFACRKCGNQLVGEEQFCGKCGSPRSGDYDPPSVQSKVATLWHMQEALKKDLAAMPALPTNGDLAHTDAGHTEPLSVPGPVRPEKPLADSIEEEMPELFATPEQRIGKMSAFEEFEEFAAPVPSAVPAAPIGEVAKPDITVPIEEPPADEPQPAEETALAKPVAANWSSATTAREFLEQLAGVKRPGALANFWRARRGDIYLAVAVVLVAAVIRWGIWSNHSVSATGAPPSAAAGHRKPAPEADLSMFDRMLISLGLAEAPPTPEYKGNPDTQVWVDLHTALYYCPGTDLYGKTPKGKFATQRDAQLDQFEPAYRKACD